MSTITVGDATITRVEETPLAFPADAVLPGYSKGLVEEIGPQTIGQFMEIDTELLKMHVHTWVLRTPQSTILIDTCNGNHKTRSMELGHMLDTDWLDRLAKAGVKPGEVDYVIITHIHLDHVGWNTSLVNGEWVPTFPNAKYVVNQTEYEFWNPSNPGQAALEFNAGCFDDSIAPVFDRGMVQLWQNDVDIDGCLHLETYPGHTPGNAAAWLNSKGEHACFAGDTMHSPIQVFRPDMNSGFDVDGPGAHASRSKLLEQCVERNALLMPAHFSAPHAYRVVPKGNAFTAVGI
ncbi:MAG: MBL fold metallo-hydrolase [Acidimicrobiales bacterium]